MPLFNYKVKDSEGKIITDILKAENKKIALKKLQEKGYFLLLLEEKKSKEVSRLPLFQKVKIKDISIFTRQISNLISSGLSLVRSLEVLTRQTENQKLREIIKALKNDVQGGSSFSSALTKHKVFPKIYASTVKAGELGGALEPVLKRLADFLEREQEIIARVKASLAYPIVMVIVGIGTIFFLLTFVIPRFIVMFQDIGQTLPLPTLILISLSRLLTNLLFIGTSIIIILLFVFFFRRYLNTKEGKFTFDRFKLRLPLLGKVLHDIVISRFARTLGTLVSNGVPILEALDMVKETAGNEVMSQKVGEIHKSVSKGEGMTKPLRDDFIFPPLATDMIAVGEETGNLGGVLNKIADIYDNELENEVRSLTSLLEPAMILIMGTVVGFIVIAMLLPIFEMTATIQ
jgi:type IV pilus assembly protein PilC